MIGARLAGGIRKLVVVCLLLVSVGALGDDALLNKTVRVDIKAQALSSALVEFSRASGVQIVAQSSEVKNFSTHGVKGAKTIGDAMTELLDGTGLQFHQTGNRTIAVEAASPQAAQSSADQKTAGDVGSELDTIYVTGTAEALSATRTETPLKEIPQSVSVIGPDTINQQNAIDIASALQQATGITLVQNQGNQTFFYSRGYQIDSIHIDGGAPLSISFGGIDVTSRDLAEFDSIELLRGSDALFGGNGLPGGTISLMRKQPTDSPQAQFESSVGSWDQYRLVGDVSGPLNDDKSLGGRLVVTGTSQDYYYDTADQHKGSAYGILKYNFGSNTSIQFGGDYEATRGTNNSTGLPRYDNGADPRFSRSLALVTPWASIDDTFAEAFAKLDHRFNDNWRLRVNGTYLKQEGHNDISASVSGPVSLDTGLLGSPLSAIESEATTTQQLLDATLTGAFQWLGQKQEVMFGADYQHVTSPGTQLIPNSSSTDLVDPFAFNPSSYPKPDFSPDNLLGTVGVKVSDIQWGVYGAFKFRPVEDLALTVGGRLSNFRSTELFDLNFGGVAFPTQSQSFNDKNKFTPYAGLTYDLSPHYTVYASYADIFQTNGGQVDKNYQILKPSDGVNIETGIKGAWFGNTLNASFALFKINQDGIGVLDNSVPPQIPCCFLTASTHSKGFETEVTGTLATNWTLTAGYTYDIHETVSASFHNELPRNLFKVWTNYTLPVDDGRWQVGGGVRSQTANNVAECNTYDDSGTCTNFVSFHQGSYTVADFRAAYLINDHLTVSLNLNNIFDHVYYQTLGELEFGNWYGAPRNFMLKLQGRY
jgi:outer-membrane receptor for ferric coprogen and ferric-rhodotorulic acid